MATEPEPEPTDTHSESITKAEDIRAEIDALRRELNHVETQVTEGLETASQILDRLEDMIGDLPAHSKTQDVREVLTVGDEYDAIVENDGSSTTHGDPMVRVDGIVVFLVANAEGLEAGQPVSFVVTDTDQSHARGVVTND